MTQQEQQLARIAAWDRFNDAKVKLAALKSKVHGWAEAIQALAGVCDGSPLEIHENYYLPIPSKEEFQKIAVEMRDAIKAYRRAREEAANFGFPVGGDETAPTT